LQGMADVLLMGLLVVAVMMVSGGLAVVARCIEASNGPIWAVPSLAFFLGVAVACAGTFIFARAVTRRSRVGLTATASPIYGAYNNSWATFASSNDAGPLTRDRGRSREDLLGFALNRDQVKEAARMILFEGQEEMQKVARARREERSACRRGHARRPGPPEPKRRRVRPRPRLFM
jgi:hypothetical protein